MTHQKKAINPLAPAAYLVSHRGIALEMPPNKAFAYILAANGLFKWAHGRHFSATAQLVGWRVRALPGLDKHYPRVDFAFKRLPSKLLTACVEHAQRNLHHEVLYQFFVDGSKIRVARPAQNGTAGRVQYAADEFDPADVILDLHSHPRMKATFSPRDNRDETGLRFYGIIGEIEGEQWHTLRLRVGIYGDFADVSVTHLFDGMTSGHDHYWDHRPIRG